MTRTFHYQLVADSTVFHTGEDAKAPYQSLSWGMQPTPSLHTHRSTIGAKSLVIEPTVLSQRLADWEPAPWPVTPSVPTPVTEPKPPITASRKTYLEWEQRLVDEGYDSDDTLEITHRCPEGDWCSVCDEHVEVDGSDSWMHYIPARDEFAELCDTFTSGWSIINPLRSRR